MSSFDLAANETPRRYVAFLDILGWSSHVLSDFESARGTYDSMLEFFRLGTDSFAGVDAVRIVSDSILVVAPKPWPLLRAVNVLHHATLINDCLLRGGIAFGRHAELGQLPESRIVSEPLIVAARLEKTIRHPCVAIDSSALPEVDCKELLAADVFLRPLLFYEGRWIVKPFNIMWGFSAATRVTQLREKYPEHTPKYDWFLRLYEAVKSRQPLVP
ncbi:MAG: hypothetical protein E6K76_11605 [Candidatus Eisenbacteria bacterium]|uniref:Guanylate cyclase domain-containing protein n=1 Tax=Eiseniibacteriota bacterium TaxID=2212470 RepID=A0A538T0A4_UNCEI|nr:MAG: hypothetical protein E6K76_11605 [Candidatus Eisenbacteria bacterium]